MTASEPSTTATYGTAVRNIQLYGELIRALRTLRDAGIPAIVLKGAALVDTIYPSIAHRPTGDIDLLVRRADRDRARLEMCIRDSPWPERLPIY